MLPRFRLTCLAVAFCLLPLAGCSTGAKVAGTAGSLVTKTTTTTLTTSGKVAVTAASGTASVAKTVVTNTGSVVSSVATTAVVTVVDAAAGTTRQIPWREGMKLYTAAKANETKAALQAVQLLRGSQILAQTDTAKLTAHTPGPALQPGDVISLGSPSR